MCVVCVFFGLLLRERTSVASPAAPLLLRAEIFFDHGLFSIAVFKAATLILLRKREKEREREREREMR